MIIHASLITDIPHYYTEWMLNRLKAGFVDIDAGKIINRYSFTPQNLNKIYFWSRDPLPFIRRYKEFLDTGYRFELVTEISLYDKCYEPEIKEKNKIINDLRKASAQIGKENVAFSYGPVFLTYNCDIKWHASQFEFLCKALHDYVSKAYVGFEIYPRCVEKEKFNIRELTSSEANDLTARLKEIADSYNLKLKMRPELSALPDDEIDLGVINGCPAGCVYCEGGSNKYSARIKYKTHIPTSSLLIGKLDYDAKIKEIDVKKKKPKTEILFNLMNND